MSLFLVIYFILLLAFGVIYIMLIGGYTLGWYMLSTYTAKTNKTYSTKATIIIPARNEEENIQLSLFDLVNQSISPSNFEIVVVDDNSTDQTSLMVEETINQNPGVKISLIKLKDGELNTPYKKNAILEGIENSTGELIITTDADCRFSENWLSTLLNFYENEKPKMIVGPVSFHNDETFFEKLQTIEFLSLIAVTGGAVRINKPIMCNGANLAYEKKTFYEAGGFGDDRFSSGDDVFLLLKIRKLFGNKSIRFLKNHNAIVYTEPKKNLKEFIHQRIRWASKNKGYDANILIVSFSVYMVNLLLIIGVVYAIFNPELFYLIALLVFAKALIDVPILFGIFHFIKQKKALLLAFPLVVLYPIYIVLTGALGIVSQYQWKGRNVKI
ncbi:MAG: glycosyltransferase [Bacteroidales bacterium]